MSEHDQYWALLATLRTSDLALVEHWLGHPNISQTPRVHERLREYADVLGQDPKSAEAPLWSLDELVRRSALLMQRPT